MKRIVGAVWLVLALCAWPAPGQVLPGHRLPEGPERPVRERSYHIEKYVAALRFDMAKEEIAGTATITFQSLRAPLSRRSRSTRRGSTSTKVERDGKSLEFRVDPKDWKLDIALGEPVALGPVGDSPHRVCVPAPRRHVLLPRRTRPAGRRPGTTARAACTTRWLPIYNDTNDRFAVEFVVTVPQRLHGGLQRRARPAEGERGRHAHVSLGPGKADSELPDDRGRRRARARSAGRREGGSGLGPAGRLDAAGDREGSRSYTFGDTPKMVEFFSQRMGYPYPWVKYDQVVLARLRRGRDGDDDDDRVRRLARPRGRRSAGLEPRTSRRPGRSSPSRTRSRTSSPTTGSATSSRAGRSARSG